MKINLPTRLDSLSRLSESLEKIDGELGFSVREGFVVRLILEELLTNSIKHGDAPGGATVGFELRRHDGCTKIHYSDAGFPFDPRADLPKDSRFDELEERPVGQLGWPLILHYCTLDSYVFADGRNRMELTLDPSRLEAEEDV